ncbi:MAG: hypothetical protein AAGE38_09665 [Pseudomonadota bacterium]
MRQSKSRLVQFALALLSVSAAGTTLILALRSQWFIHDDALISLRYAQNLIDHGVLHWNVGEPVEGYTNFLFILLCAGLMAVGIGPIAAAQILNATALIGIAATFGSMVRRQTGAAPTLIGLGVAIPSLPLILWSFGGLEAPLLALWVLLMCALMLDALTIEPRTGRTLLTALVAALAYLTRPDAAIFAVVAALYLLVATGPWRRGIGAAVQFSALFGAVILAHTLWRFQIYGDLLPNTFYAKATGITGIGGGQGLAYLTGFTLQPPFIPVLAFAALLIGRASPARLPVFFCLTAMALYTSYIARVGGDHMAQYRLFVPLIPLAGLMVAHAIAARTRWTTAVALMLAAALPAQLLTPAGRTPAEIDPAAFVGTIVGEYIAESWPPGTSIALNTAGSAPFLNPDKQFIDMLGLNDATISRRKVTRLEAPGQIWSGHAKGDGAYVLSRRPDYIILGFADGADAAKPVFLSDLEIARDPRFAECYERRQTDIPYDPAYQRRGPDRTNPLVFTYYQRTQTATCVTTE